MISHYFNMQPWRENVHPLHIWIDILAQNALWFMILLGILMGRMLKYWNKEQENKLQIEASKLQMETEYMKEQVAPSLLCSTLRKSGDSAETEPKETSAILMQLSRLLRYQLYDCRQKTVLLESEIKFLKEYLAILKYNDGCARFSISVSGQTMGVLIYPLLFVPFVPFLQSEEPSDKDTFIDINFHVEDDCLNFELTDNLIERNEESIHNQGNRTKNSIELPKVLSSLYE
jgi:sensor histidine kinase YesM